MNKSLRPLMPLLGLLLIGGVAGCANQASASIIKPSQIGKLLSQYYDAFARQPESADDLCQVKEDLLVAFDKAVLEGQCYALGNVAGASNSDRYAHNVGAGIFDAIARKPEAFANLKNIEEKAVEKILATKNSFRAEMIGLSTSYICETIGRDPETYDNVISAFMFINQSIIDAKSDDISRVIAYGSSGFYEAVGRQPEAFLKLWSDFKGYIISLTDR